MSALVIMGSGETAPTLVPVHREIFEATERATGSVRAALLDTPFGFQMNADELVTRTLAYFAQSVGRDVEVAAWRSREAPLVEREQALALLGRATWAFSGPGSPSYALRQWCDTAVPETLAEVVERGGTLVLGSAAAVTTGSHAIPVYEIYKAGEPPRWLPGLDLLRRLTGLRAAVVPHYDNAEGGTHDTRFCYLGEQRLAALEQELPDDVGVLGVDEHTALWLDPETRTARVLGRGGVTARRRGRSQRFETGATVTFDELDALLRGAQVATAAEPASDVAPAPASASAVSSQTAEASLRAAAGQARETFDTALAARDVDGCVQAVLELEQAIQDWSTDMLQSDDRDVARRVLRSLVVQLGELATNGARDPREVVGPYVETLLDLRTAARERSDYATSDLVRDRLVAAGVEVRDTADGTQWSV
ncbi:MAG: CysS/YqeB C-terminal domain-containing protein [Angustibacter sp.]